MEATTGLAKKAITAAMFALFVVLISCQQRLPTKPPADNLTLLGTVQGIVGNQEGVYQQDLYHDPDAKEIVSIFQFADLRGRVIGKAELTAAADLVSLIGSTKFNIPGQTRLKIGTFFTILVTVSAPKSRPDYYQVEVKVVENSDKVTFFIPKKSSLSKSGWAEETVDVEAAPALMTAAISGNVVLLCLGPQTTMIEARDCLLSAPAYCSKRGVSDAFIQGRMSLDVGCEKQCRIICKSHDQGKIGR